MYELIKAELRGGMVQTAGKKVEATKQYVEDEYVEPKDSSYINWFDASNLYGLSVTQKLPCKDLKWDGGIA